MACKNCGHPVVFDMAERMVHAGGTLLCQWPPNLECKCDRPEEENFGLKEASDTFVPKGYIQDG